MITFGPATRKDIEAFYGQGFKWTFRAVAARLGERTLGIGGVYYDGEYCIAFSSFDPEINKYPVAKARGVMKIMEIVRDRDCFAITDERYPSAPHLLERLGFEHVEGRIYRWPKQHHS